MCAYSIKSVTFNPGPSYIAPDVIQALQKIAQSGFLSASHRSDQFAEVSKKAISEFRRALQIPSNFRIFYQPSATIAMDTLLKNLVVKKSFHFIHGSFSKLFYKTAVEIGLDPLSFESPPNEAVSWREAKIPKEVELIAVTHNETSTGLAWPWEEIYELRSMYPECLLALDVTSSFGAMAMDWEKADIWFGSIQKCLGLPSGLGLLIIGPRAFDRFLVQIQGKKSIAAWQRFDVLEEKMQKYQTPETPNILAIALLAHQMEHWNISEIEKSLKKKAKLVYESKLCWQPYVLSNSWRSLTVLNFLVTNPAIWCEKAKKANMVLGKGYGPLTSSCIRIANFPSITEVHIRALLQALETL